MAYGGWHMVYMAWRVAMRHYFNVRLKALILLLKDSPFLFISSRSC